jgi:hypothetical protein
MSQFKKAAIDRTLYKIARFFQFLDEVSVKDLLWIFSEPRTVPIIGTFNGRYYSWGDEDGTVVLSYKRVGEKEEEIVFFQRFRDKEWNYILMEFYAGKLVMICEHVGRRKDYRQPDPIGPLLVQDKVYKAVHELLKRNKAEGVATIAA